MVHVGVDVGVDVVIVTVVWCDVVLVWLGGGGEGGGVAAVQGVVACCDRCL